MNLVLDREDMLELTRRMTPKRTSLTRIAGCYLTKDGDIDGSFNTNFLNLSPKDKEKNLSIAKEILISQTNENLKGYRFPENRAKNGSMWQLLMGMKSCGLKNDAMMDTFYELIAERYRAREDYAVFVFHGRYDVPAKAGDKALLGESEEMYEYLIGAVCPLEGEYEPGLPESGFLFPLFSHRSSDIRGVAVYDADVMRPHPELLDCLFL